MRKTTLGLLLTAVLLSGHAFSADYKLSPLEQFAQMDAAAQEKIAAKKCKETKNPKGYLALPAGKFTVYSTLGAVKTYFLASVLEDYMDALTDEGLMPKKIRSEPMPAHLTGPEDKNLYDEFAKHEIQAPTDLRSTVDRSSIHRRPTFIFWAKHGDNMDKDRESLQFWATRATFAFIYRNDVQPWFTETFPHLLRNYDYFRSMKCNLASVVYNESGDYLNDFLALHEEKKLLPFGNVRLISHMQWSDETPEMKSLYHHSAWIAMHYFLNTKEGKKILQKILLYHLGLEKKPNLDVTKIGTDAYAHFKKNVLPSIKYGRKVFRHLNRNELKGARKSLEPMLKEFPENLEALFYRAWCNIAAGEDVEFAVAQVEKLVKDNPDFYHPALNYALALGYRALNNPAKMKTYLSQAFREDRRHAPTLALQEMVKNESEKK